MVHSISLANRCDHHDVTAVMRGTVNQQCRNCRSRQENGLSDYCRMSHSSVHRFATVYPLLPLAPSRCFDNLCCVWLLPLGCVLGLRCGCGGWLVVGLGGWACDKRGRLLRCTSHYDSNKLYASTRTQPVCDLWPFGSRRTQNPTHPQPIYHNTFVSCTFITFLLQLPVLPCSPALLPLSL